MSIQKHKTPSETGTLRSNSQIRQSFLESSSIAKGKTVDIPHSYYYLFEDDDYATLGRNVSEYTELKKANATNTSRREKS